MTLYPSLEDLLAIAAEAVGPDVQVRDVGLLAAAAARPEASAFGEDAYPDLVGKAAALFHSLAKNHPLIDGNKRLAWISLATFLRYNGHRPLRVDDDTAFDFVIAVADGTLATVDDVQRALERML